MEHSLYPDFVARFYDLIYSRIRTGTDMEFYLDRISAVRNAVLEVGVGTGRLFTEARKRGADIYGIDISPCMISILMDKLPAEDRNRVWLQDVLQLNTPMRFDLIIAPFRVFSHLLDTGDQLGALSAVYKHLNPGGQFIFDLYVPDMHMLSKGIADMVDFHEEYQPGRYFSRTINMHADIVHQLSHVSMRFEWDENDGSHMVKEWEIPMRFYFHYEIEHLIARSDLSLMEILGDFKGHSLGTDSKEFIIICSK